MVHWCHTRCKFCTLVLRRTERWYFYRPLWSITVWGGAFHWSAGKWVAELGYSKQWCPGAPWAVTWLYWASCVLAACTPCCHPPGTPYYRYSARGEKQPIGCELLVIPTPQADPGSPVGKLGRTNTHTLLTQPSFNYTCQKSPSGFLPLSFLE